MSSSRTLFQDFQEDGFRDNRQANAFLASFEASENALQTFSACGQILTANNALVRMSRFSEEELLSMPFTSLFPRKGDYEAVLGPGRLLMESPVVGFSTLMRTGDKAHMAVELSVCPLHSSIETGPVFQAHIRPAAEPAGSGGKAPKEPALRENGRFSPQSEDRFRTADRLRAIGDLAGGIAHNFNNILTGLYGNITLARMEIKDPANVLAHLEKAEDSMEKAVKLTRQLLTFAKGGNPVKETFDPGPLIRESTRFNLSGAMVRCRIHLQDGLWQIHGDKGQFSQVISNIVSNARQAMPKGGILDIRAENTTMLKDNLLTIAKGPYIKLVFQDNGPGIAGGDLDRIFDPYFSTSPGRKGMGLSICHSIITKHKGYISAASQVGSGTAIRIHLPALPGPGTKEEIMTSEMRPFDKARILVMDDEEHIRSITHKMLEKFGYEVVLTEDGQEAVAEYKQAMMEGTPYALVIMDLTIPGGMGGKDASKLILDMDPDASIVVSSGYSNDDVMSDYKAYGLKGIIPKPFRLAELKETIHKLIS